MAGHGIGSRLAAGVLALGSSVGMASAAGVAAGARDDSFRAVVQPLLEQHCFACHGVAPFKGGIDLSVATDGRSARQQGRVLTKAVRMVEARKMPPATRPPLADGDRDRLVGALRDVLFHPEPGEEQDPGHVTLRRLGRFEYDRTIHDLLGVDYDSSALFPADPIAHGIDDLGDVLALPPMLFEKYADASREIVDRLLADDAARERLLAPALQRGGVLDESAVRAIVAPLMERALRRAIDEDELQSRVSLYSTQLTAGVPAIAALGATLRSLLLSPAFLFRIELGDPAREEGGVRPLTDFELATRLAYFLWSTLPDAELFELARAGRLREPAVLMAQAQRMRADPRSRSLTDHFAAQWLRFGDVKSVAVDIRRFGSFFGLGLRDAFYDETARFVDAIVREDRSVVELLDCGSTFIDGRLAQHYGVPAPADGAMARVELPDHRRGGLLGMGSILTITSFPLRTSPVLRGKWILETLLDDPPPPPPAVVPALPKDDRQDDAQTLRQRLEQHRADPGCAACHARMDPLGFALESFDAIGAWRDTHEGKAPIDPVAQLADGTRLDGVVGLKQWLLTREDDFLRAFTRRLFTFAIGRPPEFTDEPLVEAIAAAAKADGGRFSRIVEGIVTSRAFRYLRVEP